MKPLTPKEVEKNVLETTSPLPPLEIMLTDRVKELLAENLPKVYRLGYHATVAPQWLLVYWVFVGSRGGSTGGATVVSVVVTTLVSSSATKSPQVVDILSNIETK